MGFVAKSTWCQYCERWCHQRCSGLRILRRAGVVVVPQRLEVGEGSLEIVDSFRNLGEEEG